MGTLVPALGRRRGWLGGQDLLSLLISAALLGLGDSSDHGCHFVPSSEIFQPGICKC